MISKTWSRSLIFFFALLFVLQPLFSFSQIPSVKAQTEGPPDPPPGTVNFRFSDATMNGLNATVTSSTPLFYKFKKEGVVEKAKIVGGRAVPSEGAEFIAYKLDDPTMSCLASSPFGTPGQIDIDLFLIAYKVTGSESLYKSNGLYGHVEATGNYDDFNLGNVGSHCVVTGYWESFIRIIDDHLGSIIDVYLSTETKEATCNDLNSQWINLKDSIRSLMLPVDGKMNPTYWTKDRGWDPDIDMNKITIGNLAKVFAGSIATGGTGALASVYGTGIVDIEIEQQYVLTRDGLIQFNSIGDLFLEVKRDVELLQSEGNDKISDVCPDIELVKFYWLKDLESEPGKKVVYDTFSKFLEELDRAYNNFKEIFAIATMKFTTDDDDGSSFCDKVADNGIKGMLMQAFCGLIIILKTGADALYNFALRTLNSSIGLDTDITGESSPEISIFSPGNVSTGGGGTGGGTASGAFDTSKIAEYEKTDTNAPEATKGESGRSPECQTYATEILGIDPSTIRKYSKEEIESMIRAEVSAQWSQIAETSRYGSTESDAQNSILSYACTESEAMIFFEESGGRLVPDHDLCTVQLLSITADKWGCKGTIPIVCASGATASNGCNNRKAVALNWDVKYAIYTGVAEHIGKFVSSEPTGTGQDRWKQTQILVANDTRKTFAPFQKCWDKYF